MLGSRMFVGNRSQFLPGSPLTPPAARIERDPAAPVLDSWELSHRTPPSSMRSGHEVRGFRCQPTSLRPVRQAAQNEHLEKRWGVPPRFPKQEAIRFASEEPWVYKRPSGQPELHIER